MNVFQDTRNSLALNPEPTNLLLEERLTKPSALRAMDARHVMDDGPASANRAAIKELMDFVPPYDQQALDDMGMGERHNINFGLGAAIKNEAVGAYLDIFSTPETLVKIALDQEVDEDMRSTWAFIMSDEFTNMAREWDASMANMLLLADTFVTQGVAIPWFEDKSTVLYEVSSLEDCKFPRDTVAVPSRVEAMTIRRKLQPGDLFAKIEGHEEETDINGWNGPMVKRLIESAAPPSIFHDAWNYEEAARLIKANRVSGASGLPCIELVWGIIKELDGSISVYATSKNAPVGTDGKPIEEKDDDSEWVYKKRSSYDDANQAFQIFAFSIGNKNHIHTIRGLGYAIYEAGQADNMLRCKMMDAVRHRAGELYQSDGSIDSVEDLQFIDLGFGVVVPKGLKGLQQQNMMQMDKGIGYVLESNQQMLGKHASGLADSSLVQNPGARRNEMQVTAEIQHLNKMQGFAVSLFYGPYDKLCRELVRRSFTETQTNLAAAKMVERMKAACVRRGVPPDVFGKIDLSATRAVRLMGAGSKGSRIIGFQNLGELYSSMDAQGQENYNYDFASEIKGAEAAQRYFGRPGERRGHVDMSIAQLENKELLEGNMLEPIDGENKMVHLEEHIQELIAGLQQVNEGTKDISEWTIENIPLYRHCVDTLEKTSVHPSRESELKSYRQQIQQAGEVIDNGLRHINKIREGEGDQSQGLDPQGNPVPGAAEEQSAGQKDNDLKMAKLFAESQAKIQVMQQQSLAKQSIMQQESIVKMRSLDAETAAKIRRETVLARAQS